MAGYFIYMLQTTVMLFTNPNTLPYLKSLLTCLNKATQEGYTEEFYMHLQLLHSKQGDRTYPLQEIEVLNCFHFEGKGQVCEEAYLLILQTADGTKGTFVSTGLEKEGLTESLLQQCTRH